MENNNIFKSETWEKLNLKDINPDDITNFVNTEFDNVYKPSLEDFIRIPNLSPAFDPNWKTDGLLKQAADHIINFASNSGINGLKTAIFSDSENSPLVWITIEASDKADKKSVFMYGHFDKQPPFTGWDSNKGPTNPVEENGRLYGRGSSDDGYAVYAALLSIRTLQKLSIPHPQIKIMIEGAEESGSTDLVEYLEKLKVKSLNKFKFNKMKFFSMK